MGFKCGIVGLPNVGKSTLFNALTQTAAAQAANYPFCTIEPNVGDVAVPDARLETLAKIAGSKEIIPTRLTFVDIAGLVRGASKGEGLGNQFLANIRECDAIAHVVRCFEDADITHVEGKIAPIDDIETIETELMLADLESLEKRVVALEKKAKGADKEAKESFDLVQRCLVLLREGKPARLAEVKPEEQKLFNGLGLLSSKPVLYVCNVEEGAADTRQCLFQGGRGAGGRGKRRAVVVSAKIESEIAVLPPEEQKDYLEAVGPRRAGAQPRHPRRLWAFAAHHLFHRRPERGAGLDDRAGHAGAAGGGRHPYRFRKRLYPRRDHRLCRLCRAVRARPARARPASSGSKARIMSSPTAMSCISGSPREDYIKKRRGRTAWAGVFWTMRPLISASSGPDGEALRSQREPAELRRRLRLPPRRSFQMAARRAPVQAGPGRDRADRGACGDRRARAFGRQ